MLKEALTDSNRKVRRMAFMAIFEIMNRNESKCKELMPYFLSFLTDRSRHIRWIPAWYVCHVGDLAKYVPLDRVVRAFVNEKDPWVRKFLERLMRAILDAQEHKKENE